MELVLFLWEKMSAVNIHLQVCNSYLNCCFISTFCFNCCFTWECRLACYRRELQADGGESILFCCQGMWIWPDAVLPLTHPVYHFRRIWWRRLRKTKFGWDSRFREGASPYASPRGLGFLEESIEACATSCTVPPLAQSTPKILRNNLKLSWVTQ